MIGKRNEKGQIARVSEYSEEEYASILRGRLLSGSKTVASGCIEWQRTNFKGYGQIRVRLPRNKLMLAHRLAWTLANGPIPDGLLVCHRCDNPSCINVDHLFLGTAIDNMQDMSRKGRAGDNRGANSGKAKITDDDVSGIFKLRSEGATQAEIGSKCGLHPAHVSRILSGKRWGHFKAGR